MSDEQLNTLESDGKTEDGKAGYTDGDLDTGNFESIGILAGTILSRVKARKEATGANDLAPVARHAQTKPLGRKARGCLASNEKDAGGHFETSKSSTDERAVFLAR